MSQTDMQTAQHLGSVKLLVATLVVHTIGPQMVLVLPGFVQALVEYAGFSEGSAGFVASAEMFGMMAGAALLMVLMSKINWRILFYGALTILLVTNIASIFSYDQWSMMILRFCAGTAGGLLVSLSYTVFGMTDRPDRNFALGIFFVLLYGAVVYPFLPTLFAWGGLMGLMIFMAACTVLGFFFVHILPTKIKESDVASTGSTNLDWGRRALAILAMLIFFAANFAVWTYLFRIGVVGGISEQDVAEGLSISQFFGMAGAFACAAAGTRFGRSRMLILAIIGCSAMVYALLGIKDAFMYLLIVGFYQFFWNMAHPYLLAAMASFDASGRTVVYATFAQFLGIAVGPTIAALFVIEGDFGTILMLSSGLLLVTTVCIFIPLRKWKQLMKLT